MERKERFWKKVDRSLNTADGYVLRADMLAHDRKFEEAVEYYDKALEIVPGNADVWAFKGITLQGGLGKDEEAMKCWERAKALDSNLARAVDMTEEETGKGVDAGSILWSDLGESCRDKLKRMMLKQAGSGKKIEIPLITFPCFRQSLFRQGQARSSPCRRTSLPGVSGGGHT